MPIFHEMIMVVFFYFQFSKGDNTTRRQTYNPLISNLFYLRNKFNELTYTFNLCKYFHHKETLMSRTC